MAGAPHTGRGPSPPDSGGVPAHDESPRGGREGFPWAGLIAVALVFAIDSLAFGRWTPWELWLPRMGAGAATEIGVVKSQAVLRDVPTRHAKPLVFAVGTSRANRGVDGIRLAERLSQPTRVAKITHVAMRPYDICALVDELLPSNPDAVVLVLSEFDTHAPVHVLPYSAAGSLHAVRTLVELTGPAFAWRQRTLLWRLLAGATLDTYRFRRILGSAGGYDYTHFPRARSELRPPLPELQHQILGGAKRAFDADAEARLLAGIFPRLSMDARRLQVRQCLNITAGPHVEIQTGLLRDAVRRLREAGTAVLIAEAPLHPRASRYYDIALRREFLEFVDELDRQHGVELIPLEESGPFGATDFADLTHLRSPADERFTDALARRLDRRLAGSGVEPPGR